MTPRINLLNESDLFLLERLVPSDDIDCILLSDEFENSSFGSDEGIDCCLIDSLLERRILIFVLEQ